MARHRMHSFPRSLAVLSARRVLCVHPSELLSIQLPSSLGEQRGFEPQGFPGAAGIETGPAGMAVTLADPWRAFLAPGCFVAD